MILQVSGSRSPPWYPRCLDKKGHWRSCSPHANVGKRAAMLTKEKQIRRDGFPDATKDLIAKRSGYICAFPGCRRMTIAGSDDRKSGLTMTGVAAHITAAARGGPRYDADMRHDERSSERNGIWTCQTHGKLIDDSPSEYSVAELRRWKAQHEQWVFDRVRSGTAKIQHGVAGKLNFETSGCSRVNSSFIWDGTTYL